MDALKAADAAPADAFDPADELFVAQERRPPTLGAIALRDLSPYQRALLAIDGTVTRFVEAYCLEPVEVVRLAQAESCLAAADEWLALSAGAPVVRRRVMLVGAGSGRFFAWADSIIAVARAGAGIRQRLDEDAGGLGRIILDNALETRREALWFGRERPADVPPPVAARWSDEFLTRTYRVLAGGVPLMLITERFPL